WLQTAFGATRRCRASLIDYDTLVTHAGTVDLTTQVVTNRTSSGANEGAIGIGRYEKVTARATAQAAVAGVLAANPGYFPTEQVQVSQGCASGRCVHVLFRLPNGGTTISIPAE